jgi:hypothetical protein
MEKAKLKGENKRAGMLPLLVLLVLLFSMGCVDDSTQAATEYEEIKGELLPDWSTEWGWLPICLVAVVASVIIHTIVYMLAQAINSEQLKRYAISEMLQAAATALMAIVLISALVQAFDFLSSLGKVTCGGEVMENPLEADACRTNEILNEVGDLYNSVHDADWGPEMLCSLQIAVFGIPIFQGCWMLENIYNEVETYHSIAYICVNLMIGLSTKLFLLRYVYENMLAVFLPLGIILRTFHFTRGIGAFFISLAIGFYFIYPTVTFMMDSSFMEGLDEPELPETIITGMCNIPMFGSFSFGAAALASYSSGSASASQISLSQDLASFIAQIQAALLFNTMVAFAITLTFIRFATQILGGDITPFMGMVGRLV